MLSSSKGQPSDELHSSLAEAIANVRKDIRNAFSLIQVAEAFVKAGFIREARIIAENAARIVPDDFRVLRGASGVIAESKDHRASAELSERAVELAPWNAEVRLHYAVILLELQEAQRAAEQFRAHLSLEPESAAGWRNFSSALASMGDFDR